MRTATNEESKRIKVWDVATRLFHWTVVVLVATSWKSADLGYMKLHLWSGSILLSLLIFRIGWGFFGSTTSRFRDFLHPPRRVIQYLTAFKAKQARDKLRFAGHNPAGGLMVVCLLSFLALQAVTGLFSNDGLRFSGPLALWISSDASDFLTVIHGYIFDGLLVLIWMHVVAVFFYVLVKRENLISSMVTGYKPLHHVPAGVRLRFTHWAVAATVFFISGSLVYYLLFS